MMEIVQILFRDSCGRSVYQIAGPRECPVVDLDDFIVGFPGVRSEEDNRLGSATSDRTSGLAA